MAYYRGDYYRGDYYRGDPFLGLGALAGLAFKGIKSVFTKKKIVPFVSGMLMPRAVSQRLDGGTFERGPIRRRIERILPGGRTGFETLPRRRMNVANPKALRRSLRRVAGFGKLAARARRDIGRAATAVGVSRGRRGPVARHHARIRAKA